MLHGQAQGFPDERIKFPATAHTIPCLVAQGIWPEVVEPNRFFDAGTVMSAAGPTNFPVISLLSRESGRSDHGSVAGTPDAYPITKNSWVALNGGRMAEIALAAGEKSHKAG